MDEIKNEITSLRNRCNDYIDNGSSGAAGSLRQAAQRLEDEAQSGRDARSVESQVKQVIRALEQASEEQVMSHGHADELIDQCEDLRRDLQKLF